MIVQPDDDIKRIRQKMLEKKGGGSKDPNEYRFPKAKLGEELINYIRVLPPTPSMGDLWFYQNASHYIENKRIECPRIHDSIECPLCKFGFELMKDLDKKQRSEVARLYLPRTYCAVNIYFPSIAQVQEDLRGKVFWCNFPSTIYNICETCIMRDDAGDDTDPQPFGLFYSINSGYIMKVIVRNSGTHTQGDFNDYKTSKFLVSGKGPISKNPAIIEQVLAARHDLPTKFAARDLNAIQAIVNRISKGKIGRAHV